MGVKTSRWKIFPTRDAAQFRLSSSTKNGANVLASSLAARRSTEIFSPSWEQARTLFDDATQQGVALVFTNCPATRNLIELQLNFAHRVSRNFSIIGYRLRMHVSRVLNWDPTFNRDVYFFNRCTGSNWYKIFFK